MRVEASATVENAAAVARDVPFRETMRVWLKIGVINFGGPAGQIALMHRVVVDEKRWIDEGRFLHALNYCMILPGPEATQLAAYVGWLMHGVRGGVVAGTLFVLPGFFVLLGLSIAYVTLGDLPLVEGLLFGLKAAVLAIVAEALLRISRRALKGAASLVIAVAAFVAIAFLGVPFPLIVASAAAAGLLLARNGHVASADARESADAGSNVGGARGNPWVESATAAIVWLAIWFLPVALVAALLGGGHVFTQEALFFSKVAVVTFGGAYAVLAYVAQQAVEFYQWLQPDEMLTGLGLAETTPGPLILVLVFVGFLAGYRDAGGLDSLVAGTIGATITLWVTFVPSFLFIFAGAPFVERLRENRFIAGALAAVTAAVVGVIANLALWFGLHVLFAEVGEVALGPLAVPVPELASIDPAAAIIALAAAIALLRFHVGVVPVLGVAAFGGAALRFAV
ncbi:MAG: chromate efflux transporter [Propylenella sp.]